jgi:hypothetical protein
LPTVFVQGQHVAEDDAVRVVIEVLRSDQEGDFITDFRQKQEATDDGSFRFQAAWRLAVEQLAEVGARCSARLFFYRGHRCRSIVYVSLSG